MLKTLDRYVIREIIPPTLIAILIFTFLLQLPPLMDQLEKLIAKGVAWSTAAHILMLLAPQALGLTIPMGLLVGTLIGLGRLSGDREAVAMLACGVSPYRLLRPIMGVALLATAATFYIMVWAIPHANQRYREIVYDIIAKKAEGDIRPRVFFEDFPPYVLYPNDEVPSGQPGWKDLLVAQANTSGPPMMWFARRGRLDLDYEHRSVTLVLTDGARYDTSKPGEIVWSEFKGDTYVKIDPETVFPSMDLPPGTSEKTIAQLRESIAVKQTNGISTHPEVIAIQQKFSIPLACVVFALLALALGMSVARDGKFSGFVVGIAVIFGYYAVFLVAESAAKGHQIPAWSARWLPNFVFGPLGILALIWRARHTDMGRFRIPVRLPRFLSGLAARPDPAATTGANLSAATGAARPKRGTVVVVRVPRLPIPRPLLIDRYIAQLYLRVVGLSFVGLLGLFYISTFIDRSDKIFKGQASTSRVIELLAYQTPQFVYYIIPIAALLSALVTFGLLARSSELTVLKACGVSLYRASASLVLLSLIFSALLFGLEQKVLAYANRRAEVLDSEIRGRPARTFSALNRRWVLGRDGSIYHYGMFDPRRLELRGLTIYKPRDKAWRLEHQTFVPAARFVAGTWHAEPGWTHDFRTDPPSSASLPARPLPDLEPPDYFATEQPLAEMMSVAQLRAFIEELSSSGINTVPWAVELQRKLAFPFVTLIMTLLAVPFGAATGRRGTLYGIGLGIVLALSYWILSSAFLAIGRSGVLPPFLAGWAPNVLALGTAGYLLLRART
jgi:LPS export ABC transporter permease LptG/LPS export ABC transporter permease LptF